MDKRRWWLFAGLLMFNTAWADVRHAVVQVFNQSRDTNFQYPWENGSITASVGTGVIIAGNRILTNAHVVDNSVQLQVRKVGADRKYPAKVRFISDERDLALIDVEDPDFFRDTEFMELAALPLLGDEVTTYGFPVGGSQMAITRGIVSRIDYDLYAHSGYANLVCQIDAAINPGASGGPAIVNGRLAGINFQGLNSASADNVGYIIPPPVIESFLKDIDDGKVDGVPEIGVVIQSMENPQLRQRYKLDDKTSGVLVVDMSGLEKEKGLLQLGDVITAIDGQLLGNDNSVRFVTADRIDSNILVARRQLGDKIPVTVIRDGQKIDINYPLSYTLKDARIIPGHQSNLQPDFEVIGGLVIVEVNEDLMKGWKYIPPGIDTNRFKYRRTGSADIDRLLLVVTILPDEINRGYESARFDVVKSINNKPVSNLAQLRQQMLAGTGDYLTLGMERDQAQVVFARKALAERTPLIAANYNIQARSVPSTAPVAQPTTAP